LWLRINFRIDYSISAKSIGILIGIALKLQIALGSIHILTILTLLTILSNIGLEGHPQTIRQEKERKSIQIGKEGVK